MRKQGGGCKEVAARAAEEMVLHRMAEGASAQDAQKGSTSTTKTPKGPKGTPLERAVASLKRDNGSRQDMVEHLARQVVDRLTEEEGLRHQRGLGTPGGKGHQ